MNTATSLIGPTLVVSISESKFAHFPFTTRSLNQHAIDVFSSSPLCVLIEHKYLTQGSNNHAFYKLLSSQFRRQYFCHDTATPFNNAKIYPMKTES